MSDLITAPWTEEQVAALNDYQRGGWMHPFTCHDNAVLVATAAGWTCLSCDFTQDWAHAFMADREAHAAMRGPFSSLGGDSE